MNKVPVLLYLFFTIFTLSCRKSSSSEDSVYLNKADSIIALMTLDEKIGQLSLYSSSWDVTGPVMPQDYWQLIKDGKVGGIFNAYTVDYVRSLQEVAVEKSRLKIPLLFGYDVIHGHRTIFPIPLAQASSWDTLFIKRSDSIAALEATTYAPTLMNIGGMQTTDFAT